MNTDYQFFKLTAGVLATIGLYSVLYRENKLYRFFEHVFLGLAAGYAIVAFWTETLKESWYDAIIGTAVDPSKGDPGSTGHYLWALLLPIGLMGYFVFSKKNNWISRIPIGIILGLWSGQQIQIWWNRYGLQIHDSIRSVVPTVWNPVFQPDKTNLPEAAAKRISDSIYPSEVINNLIFIITLLAVLSYFLFSFEIKSKFMQRFTTLGRYLLMIGFGAIFGSTVMMRFSLLIDRMYFVWIEWLVNHVLRGKF